MKVNFHYVAAIAEGMYNKVLLESNLDEINSHCERISDFIISCGYTEEEYLEKLVVLNLN